MMAEEFEAIYWRSPATSPVPARVVLTPSALVISYREQEQQLPVTVYWQAHRILKDIAAHSQHTLLRYESAPGQQLEVKDAGFAALFDRFYQAVAPSAPAPALARSNGSLWLACFIVLLLLALVPVTYFWLLPAAGDFAGHRLPAKYERQLGAQLQQYMVDQEKIDLERSAYLRGFARQLHLQAPYPLVISVVANPQANAFAMPGGYLVVHRAMLDIVESPAELAALLGHEYGHLRLRHATRTLFRNLSGYLFVSAIFGDVSGIMAMVLENAHLLRSLQYSREFEKEADMLALEVLRQNKLDPFGLVRLFEQLKKQKGQASAVEFTSSHPLLASRIAYVKAQLQKEKPVVMPNDSLQYYWLKLKQGQG